MLLYLKEKDFHAVLFLKTVNDSPNTGLNKGAYASHDF